MSLEDAAARRLILSFRGTRAPTELLERLRQRPFGGITLYRSLNVADLEQVAQLATDLQKSAVEPLLVGTDQEGGQLTSIGDATPFPGNLALGATASAELAQAVGECIGTELAAIGVNTNYAPVCDVNSNPDNPVVGARSFGETPRRSVRWPRRLSRACNRKELPPPPNISQGMVIRAPTRITASPWFIGWNWSRSAQPSLQVFNW